MAGAILKQSGIYCIRNIENGKRYIGSAVWIKHRFAQHRSLLRKNKHHSIKLQRAWNKYGENLFVFEIIDVVHEKQRLVSIEQYWIDKLNTVISGYNVSPVAGSMLGFVHSEKSKVKISEAKRGCKITFLNPEERAKNISNARKGYVMPDSTKSKLSAINIGRKVSLETREKISAAHKIACSMSGYVDNRIGRVMPRDSVEKTRAANTGRKRTNETKKKISDAARKRYPLSEETHNSIVKMSAQGVSRVDVAKELGVSRYVVGRIARKIKR